MAESKLDEKGLEAAGDKLVAWFGSCGTEDCPISDECDPPHTCLKQRPWDTTAEAAIAAYLAAVSEGQDEGARDESDQGGVVRLTKGERLAACFALDKLAVEHPSAFKVAPNMEAARRKLSEGVTDD